LRFHSGTALWKWGIAALSAFLISGCVGLPDNVTPVGEFKLERYLGKWYEIARLDHSFERGLTHVTAVYSPRQDGGVRVVNRGYSEKEASWKEAEGKAYFVRQPDQGFLKVSFFGPFYGSYIIFELDHQGYEYSMVSGPDKSYLWILARRPAMDDALKKSLVEKAARLGFDTGKLLFVNQQ
jgi:apolipoprotein D and lipocalin family protein